MEKVKPNKGKIALLVSIGIVVFAIINVCYWEGAKASSNGDSIVDYNTYLIASEYAKAANIESSAEIPSYEQYKAISKLKIVNSTTNNQQNDNSQITENVEYIRGYYALCRAIDIVSIEIICHPEILDMERADVIKFLLKKDGIFIVIINAVTEGKILIDDSEAMKNSESNDSLLSYNDKVNLIKELGYSEYFNITPYSITYKNEAINNLNFDTNENELNCFKDMFPSEESYIAYRIIWLYNFSAENQLIYNKNFREFWDKCILQDAAVEYTKLCNAG